MTEMSEEEKKSQSEEQAQQGAVRRRASWKSSFSAVNYIFTVLTDKTVRLRNTDRATTIALVVGTFFVLISACITPFGILQGNAVGMCDLFAGVILVLFIVNRFGIINTLPRRQALLIWQLLLVFAYLGIYVTVNAAVLIAYIISSTCLGPSPSF
jgi:hypothetical protein